MEGGYFDNVFNLLETVTHESLNHGKLELRSSIRNTVSNNSRIKIIRTRSLV
jgi:hypothetical protein